VEQQYQRPADSQAVGMVGDARLSSSRVRWIRGPRSGEGLKSDAVTFQVVSPELSRFTDTTARIQSGFVEEKSTPFASLRRSIRHQLQEYERERWLFPVDDESARTGVRGEPHRFSGGLLNSFGYSSVRLLL